MNRRTPPSTIPWPPLIYGSAVVAAWAAQIVLPLPLVRLAHCQTVEMIRCTGVLIFLVGLLTDFLSVVTLWLSRTTVRPDRPATRLVTSGPFRWSRNPIYLGNTVMLAGAALAFGNAWLIGCACVAALLVRRLAITPEEKHLNACFGEEWSSYRRKTGRWFGNERKKPR